MELNGFYIFVKRMHNFLSFNKILLYQKSKTENN